MRSFIDVESPFVYFILRSEYRDIFYLYFVVWQRSIFCLLRGLIVKICLECKLKAHATIKLTVICLRIFNCLISSRRALRLCMRKIINFFHSSQETATAGQKTLTDYKLEMLSTRDGIQADFEKELRNERNNRQEIADNYDQGEDFWFCFGVGKNSIIWKDCTITVLIIEAIADGMSKRIEFLKCS